MVVLIQHSQGRAQRIRNSRSTWLDSKLEASLGYDLKIYKQINFHRVQDCHGMGLVRQSVQYVHF